jgi:hypothetical protein
MSLADDTYAKIYDPETAFEQAICSLVNAAGLVGIIGDNSADIESLDSNDEVERVEIRFRNGEATGHRFVFPDTSMVPDAWRGQLAFAIVSKYSATTNNHGKHRAIVRRLASQLIYTLNQDGVLPHHYVNDVLDVGTTPSIKAKDGIITSAVVYAVHFNVRPEVWPTS